jgi:hypothetical protein
MMRSDSRNVGATVLLALGLWFALSCFYILFRTNQYTDVDGALRCLQVYWHRGPYLGANNHLLYPFNVYLWSRAAEVFAAPVSNPIAFLRRIQKMNAIAAAGAVTLVFLIVYRLTSNRTAGLICALAYALSHALLAHATNSAEPIVGLFASLLGTWIIIEGLLRDRLALLILGGVLLSLALANYQSMFLVAPFLYLAILLWPLLGCANRIGRFNTVKRMAMCMLGSGIGIVLVYGVAYRDEGIREPRQMIREFAALNGQQVYGGFSASKLANVPIGMVGNIAAILPIKYRGIRSLVRPSLVFEPLLALTVAGAVVVSLLFLVLCSAGGRCESGRMRWAALILSAAILFDFSPIIYWDPMYDKLWLQPLALSAIVGATIAVWTGLRGNILFRFLVLLLIGIEAIANLPIAFTAHRETTKCLGDAQQIALIVKPSDKVICDFDDVSALWMSLYDQTPSRTLVFPASSPSASRQTLEKWKSECAKSGCRMLFLGLLDESKESWKLFLGDRVGVSYSALDSYRLQSTLLHRLSCEPDTLRAYTSDRLNADMSSPAWLH